MTPKEKGLELVDKFMQYTPAEEEFEFPYAKKCALIAVGEILSAIPMYTGNLSPTWEFWNGVRQEIEKL